MENIDKPFELNINSEIERFSNHLQIPDNNNIIFSGVFGIGKTYFIDKFFKQKQEYIEIILRPVNYSIASNEDIMEYIKYDIAFELLGKGIDFEETDFSLLLSSQVFILNNPLEIIGTIAKNASKVDKKVETALNSLTILFEKFKNHNKEVNVDAKKELITYLKEIKNQKGSIYEENAITLLISAIVEELKKENKKIVLVIDDIDRIDPEHIFRLFNVFACHFDNNHLGNNKFGFNKTIFVCDIDNIRNIFHNKYGMNVDFTGYIDKFYSIEIFHFDNKTSMINQLDIFDDYFKLKQAFFEETEYILFVKKTLKDLINSDCLNLRMLLKIPYFQYKTKEKYIENISKNSNSYFLLYLKDFLLYLYNSFQNTENILKKCSINSKNNFFKEISKSDIRFFVEFIDYENHKYIKGKYKYFYEEENLILNYEIDDNNKVVNLNAIKNKIFGNKSESESFIFHSTKLYYDLLIIALRKLQNIN